MPINLNLPSIDDPFDLAHGTMQSCSRWLCSFGIPQLEDKIHTLCHTLQSYAPTPAQTHVAADRFVSSLRHLDPDLVFTCEDKDNNVI
eukprot:5351806-Karenia_brevis.AAC.1